MVPPPAWVMAFPDALRRVAGRLHRWFQPGGLSVYDMVLEVYAAKAMAVAAELDIATLLVAGPLSVDELARRTATHPDSLYRILRALASLGIFREGRDGRFRNTGLSRALVDGKGSMRHLAISHLGSDALALMGDLRRTVETGQSAAGRLYGMGIFEYLSANPGIANHFALAMAESSDLSAAVILSAYSFRRHQLLVDVGGGNGTMLRDILDANPGLRGVVFDQPAVVADTLPIPGRMEVVGGDFFQGVPPGGDLYFLKSIIHDWDDEAAGRILGAIRGAIVPGGRLLLVDFVLSPGNRSETGKLSDLLMLAGKDGARERTRADFARLLAANGFRLIRVTRTVAPFSLIVAEPV